MEKIKRKDISEIKDFNRCGYHYTKVSEGNNFCLFKMEKKGVKYKQYEIWKGKQYKQPDGSIIHIKPCDKDFGIYGWYLCGCDIKNGLYRLKEQFEDFPYKQFLSAINN